MTFSNKFSHNMSQFVNIFRNKKKSHLTNSGWWKPPAGSTFVQMFSLRIMYLLLYVQKKTMSTIVWLSVTLSRNIHYKLTHTQTQNDNCLHILIGFPFVFFCSCFLFRKNVVLVCTYHKNRNKKANILQKKC